MTITKNTSTHNTQALANRSIEYIVIHYTAGVTSKAGSAVNTANYYKTTDREVSSDYTVDDAGAVLYNPDIRNRYTWHCGGSKYNTKGGSHYGKCKNSNSIGIEICSTNTTGKMQGANSGTYSFTAAAIANAVELTKHLMRTYGIAADHVIRHYDVTGKPCPGIKGWNAESGSESAWDDFKSKISGSIASSGTSNSKVQIYRVRKSWADSASQIGAYSSLENAKKACKTGYTVYDANGKATYTAASAAYRTGWKRGEKVTIADQAQLFANESTSTPSSRLRGGTYYVYDGKVCKNGRYRITTRAEYCGKTPTGKYVTGYVSIDKMG